MSAEQPSSSEPTPSEPSELPSDAVVDTSSNQTEVDLESAKPPEPSPDLVVNASSEQTASDVKAAALSEVVEPEPSASVEARSTAARRPRPANDEILPQTLLRLLGEAVVSAQPIVKQQGIKALKGTIHLLEQAIERLEAEPAPKQASKRAPASSTQPRPSKQTRSVAADSLQGQFQTLRRQLWRSWQGVLRQLRDRLPASINRKWSDQALTGAIVGAVVLLLWSTSIFLPDRSQPTTAVKAPPAETIVTPPSPVPMPMPIPPVVKAPDVPKPIESSPPTVVPSPSPPLKLTPEQTLIARIQNQVAAISNQYANGLVESVQANFRSSRLIVHISDGWYGLSRSQQDKFASEILSRTQNLDFLKLELVDGAGKLLARSPVVGTEMIILRRTTDAAQAV
ncbi:MAG: hypothetical protein KME27_30970 [Lyngbya sp. HA4199-MV5]|nr:hypothetical protein [Lyngbya sp. HA4199-MV5]